MEKKDMKVREALSGSFKILREKPIFLLPMIILVVLSGIILELYTLAGINLLAPKTMGTLPTWFVPAISLLSIIISVLSLLIYGMYPSMVKNYIEKMELSFKDSFRFSYHKFWSLLGAILLAGLVVAAVILAIAIPSSLLFAYTQNPATIVGMLIGTLIVEVTIALLIGLFFYYMIPAIIMDDMKAVAGLRRSIEVAKKNYLFTLIISLIPTAIIYAIYGVFIGLPMRLGATISTSILSLVIGSIIVLFITTWIAIIMSYAYYNIRS
jgi:hypothetical protein